MYQELVKLFQENQNIPIEENNTIELEISEYLYLLYNKDTKKIYISGIDLSQMEDFSIELASEEDLPFMISPKQEVSIEDYHLFKEILAKESIIL